MSIKPGMGVYLYHGHAFGFGAQFVHPTKTTIPTQATAIVPPTGGESFSCVKNFDYNCIVSFDEASAYATGSEGRDGSRNTLATVSIRNFNFLNMVHADLIVMRIITKHAPAGTAKPGEPLPEAEVSFRGSQIQNLWVGGSTERKRTAFNHDLFEECSTFERLMERSDQKRCYNHCRTEGPSLIHTSLTGELDPIEIPDFGRIFIGEVIATRGARQVNMLRFELGCSVGGSGTTGGGQGNGSDIPPPSLG